MLVIVLESGTANAGTIPGSLANTPGLITTLSGVFFNLPSVSRMPLLSTGHGGRVAMNMGGGLGAPGKMVVV